MSLIFRRNVNYDRKIILPLLSVLRSLVDPRERENF